MQVNDEYSVDEVHVRKGGLKLQGDVITIERILNALTLYKFKSRTGFLN